VDVSAARALLADATARGVTPAAVLDVGRTDGARWSEAVGRLTYDAGAPPARVDTIFDLASLTKVMATTSLMMRAIEEERVRLDTALGDVLSGWGDRRHARIQMRHLLEHSAGFPAHARLWETAHGRQAVEAALHAVPLDREPGEAAVYSDLGFILLGFVLEAVREAPLDVQFAALRGAWGGHCTFTPAPALSSRIAPTEIDAELGRALQGEVHDENARALGGVAGHAGLFGTAADVGAFARLVLRTFREPTALGTPALMRVMATPSSVPSSSRANGWDTMRPTSSCGALMSPAAIGHTGFTGTSIWIDPSRDLYVVLLMNRVHPTRWNDGHLALRPQVHEAVVRACDAG
jgi:CubicO group peptidase (beta-lactamase class C family)